MFAAIVILWLGSEVELAERRAELAAWAAQRELLAEPLRPAAPSYDAALADELEALLEEARATPAALGAPPALERAEALLLEHPELPQAAWLLAERYAIEAHALAAADDATASRRRELGERAFALEGARAAAVGAPPPSEPAVEARVPPPRGARSHDRVFIDGVAVASRGGSPIALAPGRHHALLWRGTSPVWAGWVHLEPSRAAHLPDPSPPCSAPDLADVDVESAAVEPAPGVRCERWAVARPSLRGGIDIAECSGSRCGPWQLAGGTRSNAAFVPAAAAAPEHEAWPSWATWSLVAAGTLAATGFVLWQVGAFDRRDPGTEFVFTGPSAAAYHF